MSEQRSTTSPRNRLLAIVHIAKKQLGLDDEDYRSIVAQHSTCQAASARDLNERELRQLIAHFERCGFRNRNRQKQKHLSQQRNTQQSPQLALARALWARLASAGIVRDTTTTAYRRYFRGQTRRYHPERGEYSAPEFAPGFVLNKFVEQLKQWCKRCNVDIEDLLSK